MSLDTPSPIAISHNLNDDAEQVRFASALIRRKSLHRIETFVRLLDDAFEIPGTKVRVGLDALIGIVPGLGDSITTFCSGLIFIEAARLGAPKIALVRMLGNILFDAAIGVVPILGDLADIQFKANRRNLAILESIPLELWRRPRTARSIGLVMGIGFFALLLFTIALGLFILRALIRFLTG